MVAANTYANLPGVTLHGDKMNIKHSPCDAFALNHGGFFLLFFLQSRYIIIHSHDSRRGP